MARVILVLTTSGKGSHPNVNSVISIDFLFMEISPEVTFFSTSGFGLQWIMETQVMVNFNFN